MKYGNFVRNLLFNIFDNTMLQLSIKPELQHEVEAVLREMGISADTVVSHLYEYIREERRLPEGLHIPNKLTRETLEQSDAGINVTSYSSAEEMYKALGI